MLQLIRDRATGWIAWVIVILICIPFALWGINQYFGPEQSLAVAEVNETEIGYYQYQNAYQRQRQELRRAFGGAVPPAVLNGLRLRTQALERLINDEVVIQAGIENGLRVGDAQLALAIRTLPTFQSDNGFSQDQYENYLRARGSSAQGFELDMRRSILTQQIMAGIQRTAIVTVGELERAARLGQEERRYRLLRIDSSKLEAEQPTDGEIKAYFDAHEEQYVQPEQVKISYVELSRDAIAAQVNVEEEELQAIYERDKANYRTAEQREARHILVAVKTDAEQSAIDAARDKITAMREEILQGRDFGEVAKSGSDDPGSAAAGGSLGYFGRGVMDPQFELAAFALEPGDLSQPVRTSFGWHIIEVTAIQPERIRRFDEMRAQLTRDYKNTQSEQIFAEQAERLASLSFEHPESLEMVTETLGLEPQESEFFASRGTSSQGISANAAIRSAAFSADVLLEGNNSELIELGPNRIVVLRVTERQPSRQLTLDEVRDDIAALLLADARSEWATTVGEEALEKLRAGDSLDAAAKMVSTSWSEERAVTRDATIDNESTTVDALFRMPRPEDGKTRFEGMSVPGGGYVVLALLGTGEAKPAAVPASQEAQNAIAETLEAGYGEAAFSALMRVLREQAEVRVFEENLRQEEG